MDYAFSLMNDLLASPKMGDALWFGMAVCGALTVSHLSMVSYIAYHDLMGHWDAYSLKYQRNSFWTYARHAPSFFVDIFGILLPALVVYAYYYHSETFEPVIKADKSMAENGLRLVALCLGMCVNNIINRLWAMFAHWVMHEVPALYRSLHKQHHCSLKDFCAFSAWQDTFVEFIAMEVLGVFMLANFFNPLPWQFNVALAVYNGVGGAIDHSAFYIPGTWIDGRYHWDHHLLVTVNYSEMEFLDRAFGTLKVWDTKPKYLNAPRLAKKQQHNHFYRPMEHQRERSILVDDEAHDDNNKDVAATLRARLVALVQSTPLRSLLTAW